jgi:hypothetical protein
MQIYVLWKISRVNTLAIVKLENLVSDVYELYGLVAILPKE